MAKLYKLVELKEGEMVEFLGVYAGRWPWDVAGAPTVGFVRVKEEEKDIDPAAISMDYMTLRVREYEDALDAERERVANERRSAERWTAKCLEFMARAERLEALLQEIEAMSRHYDVGSVSTSLLEELLIHIGDIARNASEGGK